MKYLIFYRYLFIVGFLTACSVESHLYDPVVQARLNTSVAGTIDKRVEKTAEFYTDKNNGEKSKRTATQLKSTDVMPLVATIVTNPKPTDLTTPQPAEPTPTDVQSGSPNSTTTSENTLTMEQYVQMYAPGNGSRVASPIQLQARIASEKGRLLRIELRGQDGRLLSRLVKVSNFFPWHTADITQAVAYEINMPEEQGFLSISLEDEIGRTLALSSVILTLQKEGEADILPNEPHPTIFIQDPNQGATITGETLKVNGTLAGGIKVPIYVKIITNSGKIIGQRQAIVEQNESGENFRFSAVVPFQIDTKTPVLLSVYSAEGNPTGVSHLSSVEITLSP